MFRLIKVDFYDDFSCLMSKCPDNCCDEEWDIYIDEKTISLYESIGVPDLYSKITRSEPHKLIKKDKKCPFITPEGLCMFHRDYGEDYLSNTCRSYPRFVSTYGDVYLETIGMSCPATVRQVIKLDKPVGFPSNVYYEENDEIGVNPDKTDAEKLAYSVMSSFIPGQSMIETYKELSSDGANDRRINCSKRAIMDILTDSTAGTPSEIYVKELYTEDYTSSLSDDPVDTDMKMYEIEERLNDSCELFSCNVNRMLMFERIMLESQKDNPDYMSVLLKGSVIWYLLLMALECRCGHAEEYKDDDLTDCTYKLMRVVDHGGSFTAGIIENICK